MHYDTQFTDMVRLCFSDKDVKIRISIVYVKNAGKKMKIKSEFSVNSKSNKVSTLSFEITLDF